MNRRSGWWPSNVPSPADAARRVTSWTRGLQGGDTTPPAQRPASLVIVHCGAFGAASSTGSTSPLQRPSSSPPPPPPPRSPAASSYATADEEEEEEEAARISPPRETAPPSCEGELLQEVLAIIEQKASNQAPEEPPSSPLAQLQECTGVLAEPASGIASPEGEVIKRVSNTLETVLEEKGLIHIYTKSPSPPSYPPPPLLPPPPPPPPLPPSDLCTVPEVAPPVPPPLPTNPPTACLPTPESELNKSPPAQDYDRLPQDFIFNISNLPSTSSGGESGTKPVDALENKKDIAETTPIQDCNVLRVIEKEVEKIIDELEMQTGKDIKTDSTPVIVLDSTEAVASKDAEPVNKQSGEERAGETGTNKEREPVNQASGTPDVAAVAMTPQGECNASGEGGKENTTKPQQEDEMSSGAGPRDSISSSPSREQDGRQGDMTLDDATDITLDESSAGSPLPPLPHDEHEEEEEEEEAGEEVAKNDTDEYAELFRTYENVEYRRRPAATLLSKRRLQALHPPKLGAVKNGLSRAWGAMKDLGMEGAKKIGEWARESSVPQDMERTQQQQQQQQQQEGVATQPPVPPHRESMPPRLPVPETSPPPLRPRAILAQRRSMLVEAAARSAQAAARRSVRYVPEPHEGQSGFDELCRYMKQGGDFCKELSAILQERAEAEATYAKCLSKLSSKLARSAKEAVGSVSSAWQNVAAEMEAESEAHRDVAAALAERVVKPLRSTAEAQHRTRKSVETSVDKTGKALTEWRVAEAKAKKHSFNCARENERLQDAAQEAHRLGRPGRTTTLTDKEMAKLESKRRKAEEAVKKADVEYYTFCIRSERARLEWETAVNRGSQCFQALEEQRLQDLKEMVEAYLQLLSQLGPRILEASERLMQPVQECDVRRDLQTVASVRGVGQPIPEQLLPDFYPEHATLAMNRERRRLALNKLLQLIRQDLERERRAKQGVENLARALQQTPKFGNQDSKQNVHDKLHHMRSMLTYLEATRYKVSSTLAEVDGETRANHPLASHIQVTRDRQGLQQSILKVPPWVREESFDNVGNESNEWPDRGAADGNSAQPDSDLDEFSSQASDERDFQGVIPENATISPMDGNFGQCRALYDYTANLSDELNMRIGDVISIREKQDDGWWIGELNGVVGSFPATYVEELDNA